MIVGAHLGDLVGPPRVTSTGEQEDQAVQRAGQPGEAGMSGVMIDYVLRIAHTETLPLQAGLKSNVGHGSDPDR